MTKTINGIVTWLRNWFYTKTEIDTNKQDKLVSGTNIKTINNNTLLGTGNIDITGSGSTGMEYVFRENDEIVYANGEEYVQSTIILNWDDSNNARGLRPRVLQATLSSNNSVYLCEENGWTGTVYALRFVDDVEMTYTWSIPSITSYRPVFVVNDNITTITFTYYNRPTTPT